MRDWSLYLVTDGRMMLDGDYVQTVLAAVAGGVTAVQLREKALPTRDLLALARALVKAVRPLGVPLIINDRLDIALAADADGVHVGQDDMDAATCRRLIGRDRILGISVSTPEEAIAAEKAGADYLGAGVVFETKTKTDYQSTIGVEGLTLISNAVKIPVIGIGGIGLTNIAELAKIPQLAGVAIVSAILAAARPEQAARELQEIWKNH